MCHNPYRYPWALHLRRACRDLSLLHQAGACTNQLSTRSDFCPVQYLLSSEVCAYGAPFRIQETQTREHAKIDLSSGTSSNGRHERLPNTGMDAVLTLFALFALACFRPLPLPLPTLFLVAEVAKLTIVTLPTTINPKCKVEARGALVTVVLHLLVSCNLLFVIDVFLT